MARRLAALALLIALLAPAVGGAAIALHVAEHADHGDGRAATATALALHGHAHEVDAPAHEHELVPVTAPGVSTRTTPPPAADAAALAPVPRPRPPTLAEIATWTGGSCRSGPGGLHALCILRL